GADVRLAGARRLHGAAGARRFQTAAGRRSRTALGSRSRVALALPRAGAATVHRRQAVPGVRTHETTARANRDGARAACGHAHRGIGAADARAMSTPIIQMRGLEFGWTP